MVDVSSMIYIKDFDDMSFFVNAVDDAIGPAACAVTASQRAEEWLSHSARA